MINGVSKGSRYKSWASNDEGSPSWVRQTRSLSCVAKALLGLVLLALGPGCFLGPAPLPRRPLRRADLIMVFGNRPALNASGTLNGPLRRRMERGILLHRQGWAPRLLLAGGVGPDGAPEARHMARFARDAGIPEDALVLEHRSQDTIENVAFAAALVCRQRPCDRSIIAVSDVHHLPRIRRLWQCLGVPVQTRASEAPEDPGFDRRRRMQEAFVGIYYDSIDLCRHVRASFDAARQRLRRERFEARTDGTSGASP